MVKILELVQPNLKKTHIKRGSSVCSTNFGVIRLSCLSCDVTLKTEYVPLKPLCCFILAEGRKKSIRCLKKYQDYVTEIQECVLTMMRGEQTGTCIYHELLKAAEILMGEKQNHVYWG